MIAPGEFLKSLIPSAKTSRSDWPSASRDTIPRPWGLRATGPTYTVRVLTLLLLLAYFGQGMIHACYASITFDEGPHLAIGYATLRTGDFRLQPVHIHPPLANALAAAPLLLQRDLPDPRAVDGWGINSLSAITDAVVWQYPHPRRIAVAGRVPILLLGVLLGALVFRWAKDLGGPRGGLLALTLFAFDPNLIAHGSLITTDMAAVFFIVATLYVTNGDWRLEDGGWKASARLILIGALLGLAQLTKVSALMLVPVVGLLVVVEAGRLRFDASRFALHVFRACVFVFATAAFVVWAGYGFEVGRVSDFPIPLPAATHVRIFQSLREHYDLGHATFALGRVSSHGWWWYFPAAFVLKTPVAVLILMGCGVARSAYSVLRIRRLTFDVLRWTLFLFPALYAVSSLFSSVNIGYRHLLPILPFLYVGIGVGGSREYGAGSMKYGVRSKEVALRDIHAFQSLLTPYSLFLISLLAWMVFSSLTIAPHYLAFFNRLAGGPENGYRYLVDSNLDWGQNLWDLRAWMEAHDEQTVAYAHYSPARPATYGIDATLLPPSPRAGDFTPWAPAPGLYAIGATVLQGPYAPDPNTYAWFRAREPEAKLGHALFVYRVAARPPADWAVLCAGVGFGPDRVRSELGQPNLRVLQLDCAQAHVFPPGVGLVVTPPDLQPPEGVERDFALRAVDGSTTAVLYRVEAAPAPSHPAEESVRMDGPLTFLGYDLPSERIVPGETFVLHTYWRVERAPGRPLSLLAHLIGPEGAAVAVGDGLGFPLEQWRPYDIIVQTHPLTLPPDVPAGQYTLHIGGYWLDTMERWAISGTDNDVFTTPTVEVE